MQPSTSIDRQLLTIVSCLLLAGCVSDQQIGAVTYFSYDTWIQVLCPVGTVVALIVGMRLRRNGKAMDLARAWGLMILSVAIGIPASAYFATASLVLSPHGYVERAFGSERGRIEFDAIRSIDFEGTESLARKGKVNYVLALQLVDGNYRNVSVTALMKEGALVPILESAQASGVLVNLGRQK